jgi:prepilin-type N-terminal cleavage/methylation domain-containing protein
MSNINAYMKEFIKMLKKLFKQKKGFTLIELLVVIGILGILAAALIATIDPFEQLNKAQDSTVKNTMVEYVTANIRYYATHNDYPWGAGAQACAPEVISDANTDTSGGAGLGSAPYEMPLCGGGNVENGSGCTPSTCLKPLVDDRELKASFVTSVGTLSKIFVTYYGATGGLAGSDQANTLVACYLPISQSGKKDVNAKYDKNGVIIEANCPSYTTGDKSAVCYWCTK